MFLHIFLVLVSFYTFFGTSQSNVFGNGSVVFQVGVVLDLDSKVGRMGLSHLNMALKDFYSAHENHKTRLVLHVRDSKEQVIDAAAAAIDLLKDVEVDAIVGPQKSAQANFVMDLGDRAHVPIISFSATSPSMLSRTRYFVQTALSDDTQVGAIAAIVEAFLWREVVIINEDTDYGNGVILYLSNALKEIARISYRSIIPLSASDDFIEKELYKMMTMQTRVFVVHMSHFLGTRLFLKAKEIGMLSKGYVWIITNGLMDLLSMDSNVVEAMQGVLGVKLHVPQSRRLDFFQNNPNSTIKRDESSIFGLWAYDTMWALAMAAEKVGLETPINNIENISTKNSINLFNFRISQTGPKFLVAMLGTTFEGLSGKFSLLNGRLNPSPFQILNVIGNQGREVAIWTQSSGISKELNENATKNCFSCPKENFHTIIWPGGSTDVPKGWEFPVNGKKLRIAVPVSGFNQFVKMEIDPHTNATIFGGFCIEIFKSVISALPYAVRYEFVPFQITDGSRSLSYNDLVYQVSLKEKYDGAVGDITITANRSFYVDFTLPFAEGGVTMVVPFTYEDTNSKWTFLKPLSSDLWLTCIAFFLFTGFVVWVLEHRVNTDFRGPPSNHVGLILWFPFSTLVLAHREKIVSNLARLVMTVWLFVVLILSSSYTASLSSRLTVQNLRPTVTDVNELIKNGDYVGCSSGSFIADILKDMGFDKSKITPCKSCDECDEALSKGSKNGGISALFGVAPYNKFFVSRYCGKYTTIGPIYRTDGFGFVFPKESPLVADVSRAVISKTEGLKILEFERQLLGNSTTCIAPEINICTSNSLTLQSFGGLFVISGFVTVLCLVAYISKYIFQNKDLFKTVSDSCPPTPWSRFCALCIQFDRRDLRSYPFSKKRDNPDHDLEFNHGDSSSCSDMPSLSRNCNSNGMVIPLEV
ncbi:Glutamate receptor 2.7 [Camellia lanceoleosa]|uniref:Glutamate receptor 2.7 n=1 Tax=Camellia lanceoleosa TaxID=1840588 RepID=A0ACC0FAX8_9ERIC|nr:Glutamate receptor 2.7 [Camellia lanceoleosa]